MQLRISSFNKTLFRKNLTRFWPLWGMASFIGALFPLMLFMELNRGYSMGEAAGLEMTEMYYEVVTYGLPLISLFYAVLCALAVWNYLYTPRSVGLMHTLPITRKGLFLTSFLSGMAMMAIPYVVTGGLMILLSLVYGFFEPVGVLVTIACVMAESFFYFASATAVAFVTGNVFAMPILYFIFHFLAVIVDFMLSTFSNGFLFGLSQTYNGVVEWLSPTVYLMTHVSVNTQYEQYIDAEGLSRSRMTSVALENWHLIAVYAAVGVLCLAAGWLLYSRRRSESAGDVVAVGWMKPVFRWGVTACCALLGGQALHLMFFDDGNYTVLPMVICMAVAGAIGYYAARMLLSKSLRVFKGSWKGVLTLVVLSAALCLSLEADLLGIESRVPAVGSISELKVNAAGNTYYFYEGEEAELLEQVRSVHAAIAADADYIQDFEYAHNFDQPYDESYYVSRYNSFNLTYTLKNGTTVYRRYSVPLTRERVETPGTYDYLLNELVNSEAMKTKRLHHGDDSFTLNSAYLYDSYEGYDFSTREAKEVHDAVYADLLEGNWGDYDFFETSDGGYYDMSLEFNFYRTEPTNGYSRYDYISVRLHPGMTNTIGYLLGLGVITEEELVTNAELYPDRYVNQNYQVWVEKYGELTSFPATESTSIGIIGGADGPTSIVVADMD